MSKLSHHQWLLRCNLILHNHRNLVRQRKIVAACAIIQEILQRRKYKRKKYWSAQLFLLRSEIGFFYTIHPIIKMEDLRFYNFYRMTATEFEELHEMVGRHLRKQTFLREPIPPDERLAVTLRFLASGDSMQSLSTYFAIGLTTVSNIIIETCRVIWAQLQPLVLALPTTEEWAASARGFARKWDFPNAFAALDGKQVVIEAPPQSGSLFFGHKQQFSFNLLAMCDYKYRFMVVDIGANGRQSDGGVLARSAIGQRLRAGTLNIPPPKAIFEGGPVLPYVIVADEAFPLEYFLLRVYARCVRMSIENRIFNYRLSRARRMIESTFGMWSSSWRLFRKKIETTPETAICAVQATTCLHNWKLEKNHARYCDEIGRGQTPSAESECLFDIDPIPEAPHFNGSVVRDTFRDYFNEEGAVNWQYARI